MLLHLLCNYFNCMLIGNHKMHEQVIIFPIKAKVCIFTESRNNTAIYIHHENYRIW
jgi:hypothetical protein